MDVFTSFGTNLCRARKSWRYILGSLSVICVLTILITVTGDRPIYGDTFSNIFNGFAMNIQPKNSGLSEQYTRKTLMHKMCTNLTKEKAGKSLDRFFVIKDLKIMFCLIRKVGSNHFKDMLASLSDRCHNESNASVGCNVRTLDTFSEAHRYEMFNTYLKVLFVRSPIERLWSLYNNHLASFNPSWALKFGTDIVKTIRNNGTTDETTCGNDVTFPEFLQYIVHRGTDYNSHWQPYYKMCDPCNVQFNFIGKLETVSSDISLLTQQYSQLQSVDKKSGFMSAVLRMPFFARQQQLYLRRLPRKCASLKMTLHARKKALYHLGIDISGPDELLNNLRSNETIKKQLKDRMVAEMAMLNVQNVRILRKIRLENAFCSLDDQLRKDVIKIYDIDLKLFGYSFPSCET